MTFDRDAPFLPRAPGVLKVSGATRAPRFARFVFAGLAFFLAASAARAEEAEAPAGITWGVYDAAPFMIADGPNRDRGIFDEIRHLLDRRLTGAASQTLSAPFPRILSSLKAGQTWCFVGGIQTPERDGFAVFSRPVAMFYPLRIVIHEPQRARFEAMGPLSLRGLLEDHPDLRTSRLRNRSLGPAIDPIFEAHPGTGSFSSFPEAYAMLLNDRVDYLVDYANIAAYNAEQLGVPGVFPSLPFAEAPGPVFSRVMCPKTPWGRAMIARIDAVLTAERPTPAYRRLVESWSTPEDIARIRAVYDGEFLTSE